MKPGTAVQTVITTLLAMVFIGGTASAAGSAPSANPPVYIVVMNHVEGDGTCREGDTFCLMSLRYQRAALPMPGIVARQSYSLDKAGNDLIYTILRSYRDSNGDSPKLFIEPTGEWWQTYADPVYGGGFFDKYDFLAEKNEFGIQGHAIMYSGTGFGWYQSPHTEEGIRRKLQDLHGFADKAYYNGRKMNTGKTYTGGWKIERQALGDERAEYVIDHAAYELGYRIAFEDHDGHIRNEPAGIANAHPAYYVYRAVYDDGPNIIKIDMNGSVTGRCPGNTPRCETPVEAAGRLDRTLTARSADHDASRVYYFAFVVHSGGVWNDLSLTKERPAEGEGKGLAELMDAIQERVNAGQPIIFVTPSELGDIFEAKNPSPVNLAASPFGFHPAGVYKPGYSNSGYGDAQDIGVTWTRQGVYAFWFIVQPDLSKAAYDFSRYDLQWSAVPEGIHIMGNIAPQGNIDEGYCLPKSYLPVDEQKYRAFVRAVVERYDGDGIDDMPGLVNPIKYWQVGNEPNGLKPGFADLQRITYTAIKEACPDCPVLIGGVPGMPPVDQYVANFDKQYRPILDALGGKYVDIMDFHWYGNATGDYKGAKDVYTHIKAVLKEDGFPDIPFWIAEMGSYNGDPAPTSIANPSMDYAMQTERQQALDYVKRFVYPLSFGVKKIFPAFGLMEGFKYDGGYFDFTGLIYDGWGPYDLGLGVKKLSYYSYKKMTEKLEGSAWDRVATLLDSDDLHLFRFDKNTGPVWVAWDDREIQCITAPCGRQVTISGIDASSVRVTEAVPLFSTGREVTDYASAFHSWTVAVSGENAVIALGNGPVYVEVIE